MADGDGGSSALLGIVIGGILVFVVLAFAFGMMPGGRQTADVSISVPKISTPAK